MITWMHIGNNLIWARLPKGVCICVYWLVKLCYANRSFTWQDMHSWSWALKYRPFSIMYSTLKLQSTPKSICRSPSASFQILVNQQLVWGAKQRQMPTCKLLFKGGKTMKLFPIWHCVGKTPTNLTFEILSTQVSAIVQTQLVLSGLNLPWREIGKGKGWEVNILSILRLWLFPYWQS